VLFQTHFEPNSGTGESMRKLMWWCCGMTFVVTVVGINLAAEYACRHPESRIGRYVLKGCAINDNLARKCKTQFHSLFGTHANAGAVLGGAIAATKTPAREQVKGNSPICTEFQCDPKVQAEQAAPVRLSGRIVIDEEPQTIRIIPTPAEEESETVPAQSNAVTAEDLHMDYADEKAAGSSWSNLIANWVNFLPCLRDLVAQATSTVAQLVDQTNVPECREDSNRELHYPGCPFTGDSAGPRLRPAHVPSIDQDHNKLAPDELPPRLELQKNKGTKLEDRFQQPISIESRTSHDFGWFQRFRHRLMDDGTTHPDVDTTEFRPSDAYPYSMAPKPY
jgi:hypothetical protein